MEQDEKENDDLAGQCRRNKGSASETKRKTSLHIGRSLSVRLFASMYPDEVVGLVLEDAAHEMQYLNTPENKTRIRKFKALVTFGYVISLVGVPRLIKQKIGRKFLAKEYDQSLKYIGYTLGAYKSAYREYLDSEKSAKQLIKAKPIREDLPVFVISAEKQPEPWKQTQQLFTNLTSNTEHIWANTGHSVHLEEPEVIIDSIERLIRIATEECINGCT